jgi:signal transduction histidine kinase
MEAEKGVDRLGPGRAVADLASMHAGMPVLSGTVCADDLPDGLIVADRAARVVVFNRAAARLTGIAAASALGADVRRLLPLSDADGQSWWARANPYQGLATRTRHPEMALYLADGTEVLVTVSYVRGPRSRGPHQGLAVGAGEVERLVVMLRTAHQRARLERSRADLVSTVAHELRSPLTSVKGFTATLLAKWSRFTDDQKRVMLETVNADADRVTRLITELLDVSRIESGRMEIRRQLVNIPERAEKIIAGRVAAGDPPGRFRLLVSGALPETWLDADKVDQILGNLIENAVRHGAGTVTVVAEPVRIADPRPRAGAGPDAAARNSAGAAITSASLGPPVDVTTGRGDHHPQNGSDHGWDAGAVNAVAVAVRDEGDGIAPELVPRVFRQFWRAKRRGGAGLGLFIVKGLVEAHGGTITVQPAPGGGAEFRFTMPAGLPDFG